MWQLPRAGAGAWSQTTRGMTHHSHSNRRCQREHIVLGRSRGWGCTRRSCSLRDRSGSGPRCRAQTRSTCPRWRTGSTNSAEGSFVITSGTSNHTSRLVECSSGDWGYTWLHRKHHKGMNAPHHDEIMTSHGQKPLSQWVDGIQEASTVLKVGRKSPISQPLSRTEGSMPVNTTARSTSTPSTWRVAGQNRLVQCPSRPVHHAVAIHMPWTRPFVTVSLPILYESKTLPEPRLKPGGQSSSAGGSMSSIG